MGKLFRRGKTYYADFWSASGERIRISLRTEDKTVAKTRLRHAELGSRHSASHYEKPLANALDEMISLKKPGTAAHYREKALHLLRVFGNIDVNALDRGLVSDYIALRTKEKASRHTIHKELCCLRQALKEARAREEFKGSIDIVPSWSANYKARSRFLTMDEFTRLMEITPPERKPWVMLQVYTSANKSECGRITWSHVDFEQGVITVPGEKRTSRHRRVPIHPTLREFLEGLDRSAPLVLPWSNVTKWLGEAAKKLQLPHICSNDLRRTFASWLKQAGVDSLAVAHMMGHSSTTMVERVYGRLNQETYRAAVAKLPSFRPIRVPRKSVRSKKTNEYK